MVRDYCKPALFGILVGVLICVEARPAENNAHSIGIPNKSDSVQILEFNVVDSAGDNERKEWYSKKVSYNLTDGRQSSAAAIAGSHIPVQVIYDAPVLEYAASKSAAKVNLLRPRPPSSSPSSSSSSSSSPIRRNSKQRNFPDDDENVIEDESPKHDDKIKKDSIEGPTTTSTTTTTSSVKSNAAVDFLSMILNEQRQRMQQTNSKFPIVLNLLPTTKVSNEDGDQRPDTSNTSIIASIAPASTTDQKNSTALTSNKIPEEYINPILEKLKSLTNQNAGSSGSESAAAAYANVLRSAYLRDSASYGSFAPFPWPMAPPPPSSPFHQHPYYEYYLPADAFQRQQWGSPFGQYFPIIIRDPFQSVLNYFSDLVEYGPAADVCQQRKRAILQMDPMTLSGHRSARSLNRRSKRNTQHKKENRGKYHYADAKRKDLSTNVDVNEETKAKASPMPQPKQSHQSHLGIGGSEYPNNVRGTDVGPQISKLIVRRGGVAIAGAGGIATAGSGGTAIVGPGGTAFTTPASSGGVAMVGPGGKVVKVPDLTNVLYGRTNTGGNIAATGAGHATFTTKDGQVFTTSDNTGGVALVNPGGGLLGVSDEQNLQLLFQQQQQQQQQQLQLQQEDQQQEAKAKQTNEVQLPAGARLLTTGPIIYYNPVYPAAAAATSEVRRR
ncbi:uncharacterized protein LOC135847586 isoform X2 [Planococcus citri]|uniref:uncharacterized protein LOC135847586 isoform X2 n=1 Tax=Planococcus citri TaxID=170843 RepID=UPI0031F9AE07